jgi:polysaccharide biosynthesis/export protein
MNTTTNTIRIITVTILIQVFALLVPHSSPARGKAYIVGPRDVLSITIYAGGELQQEVDLTVSAKGVINAPFVGAIKAVGLTLPQLEDRITQPLEKDYFVSPEVNIRVAGYHSLRYFISGAVKKPGLYEMTSQTTLMELIAKAGGVVPDRGNVAYILRGSAEEVVDGKSINELLSRKEPIKVDLESLLDRGDVSANLPLVPGDLVYLPLGKTLHLARSKIYVGGKIKKPGLYDYQPGLTALSACILAGGFAKFSAPNRTKIIRKENGQQTVIDIDLNDVKEGDAPDVELKAGDRIHVPESWL